MEGQGMSLARISGRAHVLGDDVNTDLHCTAKYMAGRDSAYVAQHAFEQVAPDFVGAFKSGDVIVAGRNFGINSAREQAVEVMRMLGVAAIVAPSFGRQFFRNAINNGLPVIECDTAGIADLDTVEIDFGTGLLTVAARSIKRALPVLSPEIQNLLAAGGLIPFLQQHPDWGVGAAAAKRVS
jgi:3-isopropylmalate dehydratase small subunit